MFSGRVTASWFERKHESFKDARCAAASLRHIIVVLHRYPPLFRLDVTCSSVGGQFQGTPPNQSPNSVLPLNGLHPIAVPMMTSSEDSTKPKCKPVKNRSGSLARRLPFSMHVNASDMSVAILAQAISRSNVRCVFPASRAFLVLSCPSVHNPVL